MDYRHLFDHRTSRKACYWHEVHEPGPGFFNSDRIEALRSLPRVYVEPHVGTFDDIFAREEGIEYLLIREFSEEDTDGEGEWEEMYYVNTEGYNYARYTLCLPPEVIDELIG